MGCNSSLLCLPELQVEVAPSPINFSDFIRANTADIFETYKFKGWVSRSNTSMARHVTHRATGLQRIVKIYHRQQTNQRKAMTQINALKKLDHPNVVRLYQYFMDQSFIYIILEKVDGLPLYDYLIKQDSGFIKHFPSIFRQILMAVQHCHSQGIVHRNVTLDNVLISDVQNNDGKSNYVVKLIDFAQVYFLPQNRIQQRQKERSGQKNSPNFILQDIQEEQKSRKTSQQTECLLSPHRCNSETEKQREFMNESAKKLIRPTKVSRIYSTSTKNSPKINPIHARIDDKKSSYNFRNRIMKSNLLVSCQASQFQAAQSQFSRAQNKEEEFSPQESLFKNKQNLMPEVSEDSVQIKIHYARGERPRVPEHTTQKLRVIDSPNYSGGGKNHSEKHSDGMRISRVFNLEQAQVISNLRLQNAHICPIMERTTDLVQENRSRKHSINLQTAKIASEHKSRCSSRGEQLYTWSQISKLNKKVTRKIQEVYNVPQTPDMDTVEKEDVWLCGIILLTVVSGKRPGESVKTTSDDYIRHSIEDWTRDHPEANQISDMMAQMLNVNPDSRPPAYQCLEYPFIKEFHKQQVSQWKLTMVYKFLHDYRLEHHLKSLFAMYITKQISTIHDQSEFLMEFTNLDANKDGKLQYDQLLEGLINSFTLGRQTAVKYVDQIFKGLDINNNGCIEYSEFLMGTVNLSRVIKDDNIKKLFQQIDKNSDGYISENELKTLFEGIDDQQSFMCLIQMERQSKNGVNLQQFTRFIRQVMETRGII